MDRFWICYWLFRNWRPEIQQEGQPVRLAGSNSFRKRGVSVGDSVYIVSLGAGQLYLGSRMVVERIVSRREALRLWGGDDLYDDAEDWVVGPEESGTLLRLHRRLSPALTKQLRFLSKTGPRAPFFVSETELSSQATGNLPELTPESAALLDRVIDVTDRLPRTGQLLTVTEQMLGVGESVAGRDESQLPVETPRALPHLSSAFELLKPGETGLFIYTDGLNLKIHEDGTGESGWWVLHPGRPFDRAFIFKRSEANQGWCPAGVEWDSTDG